MNIIAAVDKHWAIGNRGKLLVTIPDDQKLFREETKGKVIVMGRKTLESFPGGKPLPDRLNIVLTQQVEFDAPEGVVQVHSLPELARTLRELGRDDVYLVGGASVYARLKDVCKGGYVTHIRHAYDGAEVFFPDLSKDDRWELAETIAHAEDQDKALDFCYYRNLSPQPLEAML